MRDEDEDHRQFSEYFAARRETVRRAAYLMCGDWHWADDLAQAAFIRLAAGWHRIRDRQALDAFVRTCLVRAYLAETRRVWRRRESSFADPPETAGGRDDAELVTRRLAFAQALRQLPPRQRVTLVCRYYQGLDVAETAAVMRCTEGTVKSQTARGLAALRRLLPDLPAVRAEAVARTETVAGAEAVARAEATAGAEVVADAATAATGTVTGAETVAAAGTREARGIR